MDRAEKNADSKKTGPPWKKEGSKIRISITTDSSENSNTSSKKVSLLTFWKQEVLPRLTADLVYDHPSHAFQRSGPKWRGGSPFRKTV
jgi:hypothetical protein